MDKERMETLRRNINGKQVVYVDGDLWNPLRVREFLTLHKMAG